MAPPRVDSTWALFGLLWIVSTCLTTVSPEAYPDPDPEQYLRPSVVFGTARLSCGTAQPYRPPPRSRVDTATRVARLRNEMTRASVVRGTSLDAYIVTSLDEHQNQFVNEADRRLNYLSGFTGPAGVAVVTRDRAALWPRLEAESSSGSESDLGWAEPGPGWAQAGLGLGPADDDPYDDQADRQLDCSWTLVRRSRFAPTPPGWLLEQLHHHARVGADSRTIPATLWRQWSDTLAKKNIELVSMELNLVDLIWTEERPVRMQYEVGVHSHHDFAGTSWQEKVREVREEMRKRNADALLVTQLDEVAWLLNLRGRGAVPFAPLFPAYVLLTQTEVRLYTDSTRLKDTVFKYLQTKSCFHERCVKLAPYQSVRRDLVDLRQTIWLSPHPLRGASWAIVDSIQDDKKIFLPSPILAMKAIKNKLERQQMRNAHVKDGAALCAMFSYMEEDITERPWNESLIADEIDKHRWEQLMSRGPAFPTVAAYAAHGAHPLVVPGENTTATIGGYSTVVIDSGGQYVNGTTEVARTIHLGVPENRHIEAYTRVLQALIEISRAVVPVGTTADRVDVLGRRPLWDQGRDFHHSLGHGVGSFLWAYEEPVFSMNNTKTQFTLSDGYFFTAGPGYYVHGNFGVRLKNVLEVVPLNTKTKTPPQFLQFRTATLVPFEAKMINVTMLSPDQREWLNEYNARIRSEVGEELKRKYQMRAFRWMMSKTTYVGDACPPYVPPSVEAAIKAAANASSLAVRNEAVLAIFLTLLRILLECV